MVFLLVCFYTYTETIDAYIPKYDAYKQAEIIVLGEVMDSFVNDSICLFKKKRVFKGVIDDKIIALKYTYIKGRYLIQLKRIGSYDKFPLYKIEKFYDDIREVRFYTYVLRLKSKKRRIKRLY
ncbi:MAG TPA: hypothetical protein ENL19_00545, partial [candidate division WOR-3 bacterium]|nr:hypothetical protein [candidate division WOR-3 bacterium]